MLHALDPDQDERFSHALWAITTFARLRLLRDVEENHRSTRHSIS
jgi:hypothetical protein